MDGRTIFDGGPGGRGGNGSSPSGAPGSGGPGTGGANSLTGSPSLAAVLGYSFAGLDALFVVSLRDQSLPNPRLGVDAAGFLTPMLIRGTANDASFGGPGAQALAGLGAYEVYAMLIPSAATPVNFATDLPGTLSSFPDLQLGGVAYSVGDDGAAPATLALFASVLPVTRAVQVAEPATVFATVINSSSSAANNCVIERVTEVATSFTFQTTGPATNRINGAPNAPVDIPAGSSQSFVLAMIPTQSFGPTDVRFRFRCDGMLPAPINEGLTTLLLSAATAPVPDVVALASTLTANGLVDIPGSSGTGVFVVATVNVGGSDAITARTDTAGVTLPLDITICQTDPLSGECPAPPDSSIATTINSNETPTFGIFVTATAPVPFDPAGNRIFVRFEDGNGVVRGATSVAVRTDG